MGRSRGAGVLIAAENQIVRDVGVQRISADGASLANHRGLISSTRHRVLPREMQSTGRAGVATVSMEVT